MQPVNNNSIVQASNSLNLECPGKDRHGFRKAYEVAVSDDDVKGKARISVRLGEYVNNTVTVADVVKWLKSIGVETFPGTAEIKDGEYRIDVDESKKDFLRRISGELVLLRWGW